VVALTGAGYGSAAVVAPVLTRRVGVARVIVLGSGTAAVAQAAVAVHLDVALLAASGFLLGTAVQSAKICVDVILQATVEDGYRGRVFSFYDMVFNGAFVAAAAVAALVLPPDGVSPPALAAAALLYALTAVLYGSAARRARPQMVREYREGGAAHPPGRS
jgi:MFS family permease